MNERDIRNLLAVGEQSALECKKAKNDMPSSLWQTYSAFANTDGGTILLGIQENPTETDKSRLFTVTGVENAEKIIKNIWSTLNNREKLSVNLLSDKDIQVVGVDGKDVIAVTVPRAGYSQRPVYINNNLFRGTYRRNHEGDFHCPEQLVRMMVRDSFEDGNDRMLMEHYTMDDIDIPSIEGYRVMFRTINGDHVWNNLDHKEFLIQLGGYAVSRKDGTEGLTAAGLLMFGKGLPIRERFENLRMDYIDKSNLIGDQRYSDRLTYDGTWENNLFNFIRIVIPRLTRDLPRPFRMEGIIRVDDTPQHKAVREAFTNMIIHGDLMLNGVLRVEKYNDRFELTNPGLLMLPIEQIYAGGESRARNQRIQNMLRMIGYGENLGSGFPLILNAWSEKHWAKPELIEQPDLMQVKLILHIAGPASSALKDDPKKTPENRRGATTGPTDDKSGDDRKVTEKSDRKEFTDRQSDILKNIRQKDRITVEELTEKVGVSEKTIRREINALKGSGMLSRIGGRKGGRWVINQKLD